MATRFSPCLVALVLAAAAASGAQAQGLDLLLHHGHPLPQDPGHESALVASVSNDGPDCAACEPVPQGLHDEPSGTRALHLGYVHFRLNEALDRRPSGDQTAFGLELIF